jgi:hypothetical protein
MPSMTFYISSPSGARSFGTGTLTRVAGELALGFFRLNLFVDFVIEPGEAPGGPPELPRIVELVAEVRIGGRPLGRFIPFSPGYLPIQSYPGRSNRQSISLTCDLDRARIEAIEEVRSGGNLPMDVSIQGRFDEGSPFTGNESLVVNQGVWIDALAEMGYRRTLLIEIPLPDRHAEPEMAQAVADLEQAQRHMALGHDRDAVGSLRDALDQVTLALGDDDKLPADLERALFANSRSMSKADRLRVLRRALKLVTHPARHRDQVTAAIDWSRIDAAQMIAMTGAFIVEMSAPDAKPPSRTSAAQQESSTHTEAPQSAQSADPATDAG